MTEDQEKSKESESLDAEVSHLEAALEGTTQEAECPVEQEFPFEQGTKELLGQ